MNSEKFSPELTAFISLVPKHLRKFIRHGIFMIPTEALIQNYQSKKEKYMSDI